MKKISKRIFSIVLCLVLFTYCFPKTEVKAANNTVELSVEYLNRAKCWEEAANFLHLGYSQTDIAAEIYAHAIADNISYRELERIFKNLDCDNSLKNQALYYFEKGFNTLTGAVANKINNRAHVVNIGGDNFSKIYRALWNTVFLPNNNTYYSIQSSLNKKKVIDVDNNSNKNGTKIQLYSANGTNAQEFELFFAGWIDGEPWYYIFKKGQFKCLDVTGGVAGNGVNIQLYDYNGTAAQQWCFIPAGDGSYYLKNRLGFYMDACGGSSNNGTQIWTYSLNKTSAQKWWLNGK